MATKDLGKIVSRLEKDAEKLSAVVNGGDTETVTVGSGQVPTVAKVIKDVTVNSADKDLSNLTQAGNSKLGGGGGGLVKIHRTGAQPIAGNNSLHRLFTITFKDMGYSAEIAIKIIDPRSLYLATISVTGYIRSYVRTTMQTISSCGGNEKTINMVTYRGQDNNVHICIKGMGSANELYATARPILGDISEDTSTTDITGRPLAELRTGYWYGSASMPVGSVLLYCGRYLPKNHGLANGSEYDRVEYADLFREYGTTYGSGDGSTTFNVINLDDKMMIPKRSAGVKIPDGASANNDMGTLPTVEVFYLIKLRD